MLRRVRSWFESRRAPGDICITARTNKLVEKRYAQILKDAGFSVQIIKTDETKLGDGVRVATMHRIKSSR